MNITQNRLTQVFKFLKELIHTLWTTMQCEGDRVELVLGDGMLGVPDQLIRHPVLLQRVNLEFNPSGPELRFHTGTEKVELHRALLRLVPSIIDRRLAQAHIWLGECFGFSYR